MTWIMEYIPTESEVQEVPREIIDTDLVDFCVDGTRYLGVMELIEDFYGCEVKVSVDRLRGDTCKTVLETTFPGVSSLREAETRVMTIIVSDIEASEDEFRGSRD